MYSHKAKIELLQGLACYSPETLYEQQQENRLEKYFRLFADPPLKDQLSYILGMKNWDELSHYAQEEILRMEARIQMARGETPIPEIELMARPLTQ